jgi:hypothetical protein
MTVIKRTETALGGFFADPATMTGRATDGGRLWSYVAVEQMATHALARGLDPTALRPASLWDVESTLPFPALRRLAAKSPAILRTLPEALCARPGTRYVEAIIDRRRRTMSPSPVALDPGGDLADWPGLIWLDRSNGHPIRVTTDPTDTGAVLLDTLDNRAMEWTAPPRSMPIDEVYVDPLLVQVVGRVSGVIDADLDGSDDPGTERPVYNRGQRLAAIRAIADDLGPREFARRTGLSMGVTHRAASGDPISARNVEKAVQALRTEPPVCTCALDGCDEQPAGPGAVYCGRAHKDQAYRVRRTARLAVEAGPDTGDRMPVCSVCGTTVLLGAALRRGTCRRCLEEAA